MPDDSGLVIKGDARKVLPIKIKGNDFLVVAVNNGDLQIFEINPQEYIPDQIKNQKE
jgi:hypothetical protein